MSEADNPSIDAVSSGESRWPATVAVAVAMGLHLALPERIVPGPRFIVPAIEAALVVPLMIGNPSRLTRESRDLRAVSIALIGLLNAAAITSLSLLIRALVRGDAVEGRELIRAAVGVWLTLVIGFGLWYWELDRGGPAARCLPHHGPPDFSFPQMETRGFTRGPWTPKFLDYLYVALTNSMAFSPTDAMPLTRRAKALMAIQSLASLAAVVIVSARAVNILK